MDKIPFYFSVDFEDYYHDKRRDLGHNNPLFKIKSLWKSYEILTIIVINILIQKRLHFYNWNSCERS